MSDNLCPICGKIMRIQLGTFYENDFCHCERTYTWTLPSVADLQSEIARLKAALETARNEYELMRTEILARIEERDEAMKDRDKARKLARHFYRLYLIERKNIDTFYDGYEWGYL